MRAGLSGARSGLFSEQIRVIREMRETDKRNGRTDIHVRPRFGVWENVPGALSSGRDPKTGEKRPGEDFRIVLESFLKIEEPYLHVVRPAAGRWEYAGAILGVRSCVAWVVWDAIRISIPSDVVVSFLWQILQAIVPSRYCFIQQSLQGHPATFGGAGQTASRGLGAGPADSVEADSTGRSGRTAGITPYQSEK